MKIAGKRALVCAASKGLGRSIALALAEEGVRLVLCARNREALDDVAARAGALSKADVE
ncbi:MAG TPA: SDR family NAD(P)-dependent oxidoreductase, partial [Chroococcales cyanobacterium]